MTKKQAWFGVAAVSVLAAIVVVFASTGWARFGGQISAVGVDLAVPDGYLSTPALSQLPRDLVKAPVLRDLLTEDFAFYYEEHEDRLGLRGAIKRIAYEHDKTLADSMLELALDQPAEMAFWVDAKGAPRYWLLAMTRGVLARTLQEIGSIAARDKQLSEIGSFRAGDATVTAYALHLSARRTLAILARGERVVVLSDPGLLFDAKSNVDHAAAAVVGKLLADDAATHSLYRQALGLGAAGREHTIVADVRLLSFGYRHFFPGLKALRVDVAEGGASIKTRLRVASAAALPAAPADRLLWSAMPANAAACAVVPADWGELKAAVGTAASAPAPAAEQQQRWSDFIGQLEGPAAICWYARSQMQTPIVVARTKAVGAEATAALGGLANWAAPASAVDLKPPPRQGAARWAHEVKAPWGAYGDDEATSYRPTFALQGRWVTFSPDDKLVDLALDAQARRYPSMAESLPAEAPTLAVFAPRLIAELTQREAFVVLPLEQELFRQAAERRLLPRLAALAKLPPVRAVAQGAIDSNGWVAVEWVPVVAAAPTASASNAASGPSAGASSSGPRRKP